MHALPSSGVTLQKQREHVGIDKIIESAQQPPARQPFQASVLVSSSVLSHQSLVGSLNPLAAFRLRGTEGGVRRVMGGSWTVRIEGLSPGGSGQIRLSFPTVLSPAKG
jgi:hypothetical protein